MAAMANRSRNIIASQSPQNILFELQVEQHHHDEVYHREVARLPMHQRINHMALHFAKYTGKVAATYDTSKLIPVYVDVFIITLSTANILNLELWDLLENDHHQNFPGLLAFGRALAATMTDEMQEHSVLVQQTAIACGDIAAACEKIDHLEEVMFRSEIKRGIARLSGLSLAFLSLHGIDPAQAARERLGNVKKRLKLHGRI